MIASVALALLSLGLRVLFYVASQRASYVIAFLELPLFISPHKAFVTACVDQFSI